MIKDYKAGDTTTLHILRTEYLCPFSFRNASLVAAKQRVKMGVFLLFCLSLLSYLFFAP